MSEVNQQRCIASQIIINIMNADVSDEEKAEQLKLLWMHAESAYEKVTGEKPSLSMSPKEKREFHAALDAYDNIEYVAPDRGLVHKRVRGSSKTLCGIKVGYTWTGQSDRRAISFGISGNCDRCWPEDQ